LTTMVTTSVCVHPLANHTHHTQGSNNLHPQLAVINRSHLCNNLSCEDDSNTIKKKNPVPRSVDSPQQCAARNQASGVTVEQELCQQPCSKQDTCRPRHQSLFHATMEQHKEASSPRFGAGLQPVLQAMTRIVPGSQYRDMSPTQSPKICHAWHRRGGAAAPNQSLLPTSWVVRNKHSE
jgi:hypothetical protein